MPTVQTAPSPKQQLAGILRILLERVYGGDVTAIVDVEADADGKVEGLFRDGTKLLEFDLDLEADRLNYGFVTKERRDSWLAENLPTLAVGVAIRADASPDYIAAFLHDRVRSDAAKRKPAQCTGGGLSCGMGCIDPREKCKVKPSNLVSAAELHHLKGTILRLGSAAAEPSEKADPYAGKSIRELQQIAKDRDVYRANHMSKDDLTGVLTTLDRDPEHQERLRKSLEKRRQARAATRQAFTGGGTKKRADPIAIWKQLEKISRLTGTNPQTAAILAGALLAGMATSTYQNTRDRYKSGLQESSQLAMARASQVQVTPLGGKSDLTFAVGGFSSTGSLGEKIRDELNPQDDSPAEQWFGRAQKIIPFNHPEFDIPPTAASKRNTDGSYNPAYLGHVAKEGFGKYLQNLRRGRNEASVDLAAQMYAHGVAHKNANLNVLGHGAGGNVVNEATEILARMKPDDGKGPAGSDLLKRLNIVNLGTPSFGFANDPAWKRINHRTITSQQDPFSKLPKKLGQWISTVPGHEVGDYLKDPEVRDRLRESFGYYQGSLNAMQREASRRAVRQKTIGESLKSVGLGTASRVWDELHKIKATAKENPESAALAGGALLISSSRLAYKMLEKRKTDGLPAAANAASTTAEQMADTVPNIRKPNVVFAVGGTGTLSTEVAQQLKTSSANADRGGTNWINREAEVIPFEIEHSEIPENLEPGSTLHNAYIAQQGFGKALSSSLNKGQENDPVRLAAHLYAHGDKEHEQVGEIDGKRTTVAAKLPLNVVAYDTGGMVARDAIDILKRMKPNGKQIAGRVQLVTLGTPAIGKNDADMPETNIMGDRDPFSQLPFQRGEGKTAPGLGVDSHSLDHYLGSTDVINQITRNFQGNSSTRQVKPLTPNADRPKQYPIPKENPSDRSDPRFTAGGSKSEAFYNLPDEEQGRQLEAYRIKLREQAKRTEMAKQARAQSNPESKPPKKRRSAQGEGSEA